MLCWINCTCNRFLGNYSLSIPHTYPSPTPSYNCSWFCWTIAKPEAPKLQMLFSTFLSHHCRTGTWNILISCTRFKEYVNKRKQVSFLFFSTIKYSPFRFNARIFLTTFDKLYNPYSPLPLPDRRHFCLRYPIHQEFPFQGVLVIPPPPGISRICDRNPRKEIVSLPCFERYQSAFK